MLAAAHGARIEDADFSMSGQRNSLPAVLTHDNHPDLIGPEETVSTLAVGAVLAVEEKDGRSTRALRRDRFYECFVEHIEKLRQPPNHVKWREVAICTPMNGWTRFPLAEQWLKNYPGDGPLEGGNQ